MSGVTGRLVVAGWLSVVRPLRWLGWAASAALALSVVERCAVPAQPKRKGKETKRKEIKQKQTQANQHRRRRQRHTDDDDTGEKERRR